MHTMLLRSCYSFLYTYCTSILFFEFIQFLLKLNYEYMYSFRKLFFILTPSRLHLQSFFYIALSLAVFKIFLLYHIFLNESSYSNVFS